ncbi:MAG: two-component system sensor histidine kinase NtrB, partial [Bradymonadaceae bacterium]
MPASNAVFRERLEGLMLFRVVLVTALLGTTIALDLSALSEFSDPRNATLVALIVGTYLLTILYAFLLRSGETYVLLAYIQIAGDLLLATILVMVTGGLDSIFVFLFFLNIITAAVVIGSRSALYVALATIAAQFLFFAIGAGLIANPVLGPSALARPTKNLLFEITINSTGAVLIAVLSGFLAKRLGEVTTALERQKVDIEELRALNRNILTSLSSGLLTINSQGEIIFFNSAAEAISGRAAQSVLHQPLATLFPDIARTVEDTPLVESPDQSGIVDTRFESLYTRPDGTSVYLGFSLSILRNSAGDPAGRIVIFQDLSDIRRLEQQMKRSERLAAVGELAAAIAHEIRNPLASISGSAELLKPSPTDSPDEAALMDIVIREVERLDKLITDFLGYCNPRSLQLEQTDLEPLIENVLKLFRNQTTDKTLVVDFITTDGEPPRVFLDPEAIQQVLWNLLKNATDAARESPSAEVHIRIELHR